MRSLHLAALTDEMVVVIQKRSRMDAWLVIEEHGQSLLPDGHCPQDCLHVLRLRVEPRPPPDSVRLCELIVRPVIDWRTAEDLAERRRKDVSVGEGSDGIEGPVVKVEITEVGCQGRGDRARKRDGEASASWRRLGKLWVASPFRDAPLTKASDSSLVRRVGNRIPTHLRGQSGYIERHVWLCIGPITSRQELRRWQTENESQRVIGCLGISMSRRRVLIERREDSPSSILLQRLLSMSRCFS